MAFGGAGLAGLNNANKKPTKKCERCGLRYPADEDSCVHCNSLNEQELQALKDKVEKEHRGNARLGRKFLLLAFFLLLILFSSYLQL